MRPLTALVYPALLLFASRTSATNEAAVGSKEQVQDVDAMLDEAYELADDGIQGLHELFQRSHLHRKDRLDTNDLVGLYTSCRREDVLRYLLCRNPKISKPLDSESLENAFTTFLTEYDCEAAKLLMCQSALDLVRSVNIIKSVSDEELPDEYSIAGTLQERKEFCDFCFRWAPLVFMCRSGKAHCLDVYAPDELDDEVLNLLLDATFFGCQRRVTRQLAALLLQRYAASDMAALKAAHEAAVAQGLIHVVTFLKMLGRARMRVESASTRAFGLPELTPLIQNVVSDFTKHHHQLYEKWHGGPHQKDLPQPQAKPKSRRRRVRL